jgi:hypothetical protein
LKLNGRRRCLLLDSNDHGDWIPVRGVRWIVVRNADAGDVVSVERRGDGNVPSPDPLLLHGPGRHAVIIPRGEVRIKREAGVSKITVFAES